MRSVTRMMFGLLPVMVLVNVGGQTKIQQASSSPFWGDLGAGPYPVGYRVIYRSDPKGTWSSSAKGSAPGRPVRVSLWYPAANDGSGKPMTYGDYLHHAEAPTGFEQITRKLDTNDLEGEKSDFAQLTPNDPGTLDRILALPVAARSGGNPAPGRHPLVLYSGGKASRADTNVELEEYLASNGYVVATVPELGPSDTNVELGSSPSELILHADDFDFALGILRGLPFVATHSFAAIGHSAGGEVAIELAFRHPELKAVIGLDGSFGMTSGARVFKRLPGYRSGRKLHAALLDLRRSEGSQGVHLDLTAVDALRWKQLYRKAFPGAYHGDFTEWGMVAFVAGVPMPTNPYQHTRQIGVEVNRSACHLVLDFLNYEMRGEKKAGTELKALKQ
jgi:hypothetical protein